MLSIRTKYGSTEWTTVRGGDGGLRFNSVELEAGEMIRAVYVSTTTYQTTTYTATAVCKITFLTKGKTFGPYGTCTDDTEKSFFFPNGLFYFSGRIIKYINQLNFNSLCPNTKLVVPTRGIHY